MTSLNWIKALQKKQAWNERRKELHKWIKRAEAVGIKPLPSRRPTQGQRLMWEESIIQAEEGYRGDMS